MKSSYKLLSLFGINVEMHISFILFIAFLFMLNYTFALLLLVVFVFVTLHEFSHSLVAKKLKIRVDKIILLPIGGMALMDIKKISPLKEVLIAVAGPLFNFLMCYLLIIFMYLFNLPFENAINVINEMHLSFSLLVYYSFYANLILGSFNLFLPAFPLDGGRILRAALSLKFNREKATLIARNVSFSLAFLMLVYSIFSFDIWIMIIAGFIFLGANGEYKALLDSIYLSKVKVDSLLSTDFFVAGKNEVVKEVADKMMMFRRNYAVIEDNFKLFDLSRVTNFNKTVDEEALNVPVLRLRDSLEVALNKMNLSGVALLPVVEKNELVGIVKRQDILNFEKMSKLLNNKYVKRVLKL